MRLMMKQVRSTTYKTSFVSSCSKGRHLQTILSHWDKVLVNLRTPLSEDCEKLLFYTLIRPIPIMKYDVADYDRKVASHP